MEFRMKKIVVGLTGASGSIYFHQLLQVLMEQDIIIHIIATEHGAMVLEYETGVKLEEQVKVLNDNWGKGQIILENNNNLFSGVASGSYPCDAMVIIPCSMSTLAEISNGITKNLLTRAADVFIKEKRKLVIVPRETPLSTIHLKNMYELSKLGVTILPAMPGFYNHPKSMDDIVRFVVGKTLDSLGVEHNSYDRWRGNYENE